MTSFLEREALFFWRNAAKLRGLLRGGATDEATFAQMDELVDDLDAVSVSTEFPHLRAMAMSATDAATSFAKQAAAR